MEPRSSTPKKSRKNPAGPTGPMGPKKTPKIPRIGKDYSRIRALSDGTKVRVRLLRTEDRAELLEGFDHLSSESRYTRFFSATPRLTDGLLRQLMDVDDVDHLAVVAETPGPRASARGLGIARFARLREDSDAAEVAITVIDEMQGRGLGTLLLSILAEAARERGIRKFHAVVLPSNNAMRELMRKVHPQAVANVRDGIMYYETPL